MKPLYEESRPQTIDDIVGQPKAVHTIKHMAQRGLLGRVFFITGKSGSGKTTLARIIAKMVSLPYAINEFDAADLSIDRIRDIERECRMKPIGCSGHAYICNECHNLRGPILARLNTTLESPQVQDNSVWVFTTTLDGEKKLFDHEEIERVPFGSRTIPIRLASDDDVALAFAMRAREVAKKHGMDGRPLMEYIQLVKNNNYNLRQVFQSIEAGSMMPNR